MRWFWYFVFILLYSFLSLHCSEYDTRSPIGVVSNTTQESSYGSESSEDIICAAALDTFNKHASPLVPEIKSHIMRVLSEDKISPLIDHDLVAQDTRHADSLQYIHDVVIKATSRALEEQHTLLKHQESKILQRFNKKQMTALCSIAATICSGIVGISVHFGKKC